MRRLFLFAPLLLACTRSPPDSSPEGAVRAWLDRMEASTEDPRATKDAYALLGPAARANLEERAKRTSLLIGRRVDAWEMLAEGRFGLHFRPKTIKTSIVGDRATVEVLGHDPLERASVRCLHEPKGWRLELDLPEMVVLPKREPPL